jgi:superfamily II DNA or RNA helicase
MEITNGRSTKGVMMEYAEFLRGKAQVGTDHGFEPYDMPKKFFSFQKAIGEWSVRKGRAAIFSDCGSGKTGMQLAWADNVAKKTGKPILVLAPLAVGPQTVREGEKFGIEVTHRRNGRKPGDRIVVTNYERLHYFDSSEFAGVVLDESSILKSYTGKYKTQLLQEFSDTPYRLACTATPAPNDYMELGNHCEFLGVMRSSEMLAAFFINDAKNVGRYRLKGYADAGPFWQWMACWSVMIRRPSDLGYDDGDFKLPPLNIVDIVLDANTPMDGFLFPLVATTMSERRSARKATIDARVGKAAELANSDNESWLVWCDLNDESAKLTKAIDGAVEVKGSDKEEHKEQAMLDFQSGKIRVLVSKPSIAGWGMNFQHCHKMVFTGLSDSYEQYYQAVRRCWRFGQKHQVDCYIVTDQTEGAVVSNVRRKQADADAMAESMARQMSHISSGEVRNATRFVQRYEANQKMEIPEWLANGS